MSRIVLGVSLSDAINLIADNDDETHLLIVSMVLHNTHDNITDSISGYMSVLQCFDESQLYGRDILKLYKEVCDSDIELFIGLIKSCQHDGSRRVNFNNLRKYLVVNNLSTDKIEQVKAKLEKIFFGSDDNSDLV